MKKTKDQCSESLGEWRCEKTAGHKGAHQAHTRFESRIRWWTGKRPLWAALR